LGAAANQTTFLITFGRQRPMIPPLDGCSQWNHPSSPLSSRAKPRDLRFSGLFLEMFFARQYPDLLGQQTSQETPDY
jgi:hypothetical protein